MIGVIVTTFNRPKILERSLPQIAALGAPVLVVDDGTHQSEDLLNAKICFQAGTRYLWLPENRGLSAAMNIGISYWLADKSVDWISYFQDDVDVHPRLFQELAVATKQMPAALYTGHDSRYHAAVQSANGFKIKQSCAAVHMHAKREFWQSIMPIPTFALGAPKRLPGRVRGVGSDVDWWIVRDSPHSIQKTGDRIVCLPNLVRTFLYKADESSWGNSQPDGEEPPLRQS